MTGRSALRAALFLIVVGGGAVPACAARSVDAPSERDREAERYVRLLLALAERDPDSLDSYFGPKSWQADAVAARASLAAVQQQARALVDEIAAARRQRGTDDDARYDFLARQLRALVARVDVLSGHLRSFSEESRLLFGVAPEPIDRDRVAAARQRLERLLPGHGPLAPRLAAFERRFVVPPDRLETVLGRALDGCRAATQRHVTLPPDEHVDVDFVGEWQWTAFTRYQGAHRSKITINRSVAFTVDDVLDLACHEAYPGHHVINVLVDDRLVRAHRRVELTAQFLFSPQALLSEGAASVAPALAFTDEERVAFERAVLYPAAGVDAGEAARALEVSRAVGELASVRTDVSARYVDGALDFARAAAAFERDAVMPAPDAMLKFLNEYRSYVTTYARGPALASAFLDAHGDTRIDRRWAAYVELVTNPDQTFPQIR